MQDSTQKICPTHNQLYQYICLDQQCKSHFLLCQTCKDSNLHKHSKTAIEHIKQIQQKLSSVWQLKDQKIETYSNKIRLFYDKLRKDVIELINEDQKIVESLLQKISYYHLPVQASSLCYLEFKKQQYQRIDKSNILKLITQADSGQLNKNLQQQKQIFNLLDSELKKTNQKLITIKYVMLSKKMQAELLTPKLQENSQVCLQQDMCKVYGLFNSKNLLIRNSKLIYRASQSKFSPSHYFNSCNNLPNCMVLVKLQNGKKVGGFSSIPFVHPHEEDQVKESQLTFQQDRTKRNFIFSLSNVASFELKNYQKALAFQKNAIGPIFGQDLNLSSKKASSNLGKSYQPPPGVSVDSLQAKVYLLGAGQVTIQQMEIWQLCF